jgi:CubicO group peptidase (beta-lactamase class C family)
MVTECSGSATLLRDIRLWVAVTFLGFAAGTHARAPTAEITKEVDAVFAKWSSLQGAGCALSAVKRGEKPLERAWGSADLEHEAPNTVETIFEAGSVSKQFVAAAALTLVQDGRLALTDDIRKFVPELPRYESTITIDQLITHTSGLRDWGSVSEIAGWPRGTRTYTLADVLDIASRQKALNHAPGSEFSYTNTGYNLLVLTVQRITGQSFPMFTRTRLFEPLGMKDTSWRDDFRRVVKRRAIAYERSNDTWRQDMPFESAYGNGGMLTTVRDLQRWNAALDSGQLGPFITTELQRRTLLKDGQPTDYARGLFLSQWRGQEEISHGGATAGYRTWLGRFPKAGLSIAVLCNASDVDTNDLAHQVSALMIDVSELAAEPPVDAPTPSNTAPASVAIDLQPFVGRYRSDEADATYVFEIESGQGVFRVDRRPEIRIPLVATGPDAFRSDEPTYSAEDQTVFRFYRDAAGRIAELGLTASRVRDLRFQRNRLTDASFN